MSLINEALKKAQKQRNAETAAALPAASGPIAKRAKPRSAKSVVLLAGGAAGLVVVSVVVTLFLFRRHPVAEPAKPAPPVVAAPVTPAPKSASEEPPAPAPAAPPVVAQTAPPKPAEEIRPAQKTVAATVAARQSTPASNPPTVQPPPTAAVANVPSAPTAAPPAAEPPPVAAPKADERIHAFVDALKIAGVKASGNDSRVLMNDRVYRVNDIVERSLGVRLIKVEIDNLTFSDANGITYVRYF